MERFYGPLDKGLKAFASNGTTTGINPSHAKKLRKLLGTLQQVRHLGELSNGFGLHSFRNAAPNSVWVIRVSPQWRLLFQWDGNARQVINLDYLKLPCLKTEDSL